MPLVSVATAEMYVNELSCLERKKKEGKQVDMQRLEYLKKMFRSKREKTDNESWTGVG